MMMKGLRIVILLMLMFSACKPVHYFSVEIIKPSPVSLSANADSIVLAYNILPWDTAALFSGLSAGDINDLQQYVPEKYMAGLEAVLEDSPFSPVKYIEQYAFQAGVSVYDTLKKWKDALTHVIKLGPYWLHDTIILSYDPEKVTYVLEKYIYNYVSWELYNISENKLIDKITIADTIVYRAYNIDPSAALYALPGVWTIIRESCESAGARYGRRIVPYWDVVKRPLYVQGNVDMWVAKNRAMWGNWEDAEAIWKYYLGRKKLNPKVTFNLAVASEVKDDLEAALYWANRSKEYDSTEIVQRYIDVLKKRIKIKEQLLQIEE